MALTLNEAAKTYGRSKSTLLEPCAISTVKPAPGMTTPETSNPATSILIGWRRLSAMPLKKASSWPRPVGKCRPRPQHLTTQRDPGVTIDWRAP